MMLLVKEPPRAGLEELGKAAFREAGTFLRGKHLSVLSSRACSSAEGVKTDQNVSSSNRGPALARPLGEKRNPVMTQSIQAQQCGERTKVAWKSMKPEQAEYVKRETSVLLVDVGWRS